MNLRSEIATAAAVEPKPEALAVNLGGRLLRIPWERCSRRLARASIAQRLVAELSPGGYGVNLAVA